MNLRNTFNLGVKELRGLWRDPVMLVLIVYSFSLSVWTSSNAAPEALTNAEMFRAFASAMPGVPTVEYIDDEGQAVKSETSMGGLKISMELAGPEVADAELEQHDRLRLNISDILAHELPGRR